MYVSNAGEFLGSIHRTKGGEGIQNAKSDLRKINLSISFFTYSNSKGRTLSPSFLDLLINKHSVLKDKVPIIALMP